MMVFLTALAQSRSWASAPADVCTDPSGPDVVTVQQFGAVGDGQADDYAALQRAAQYMSQNPGKTLVFPPGVYKIDQYVIDRPRELGGDGYWNGIESIFYRDCHDIRIVGCGAVIDVKGDFFRGRFRQVAPDRYHSDSNQVIPFYFVDCSDFRVEGFELYGHVEQMRRDGPEVLEGPNHGINTARCRDYTIADMYIHHFAADGLRIGGGPAPDHNVEITGVLSQNNARQGLSIIQARAVRVADSEFSDSGRGAGAYGGHAPMAGVDVEPNFRPPDPEDVTGDITLERCTLKSNRGSQFTAYITGSSVSIENLEISGSTIIAGEDSSALAVVLAVKNGVLADSQIDTQAGAIHPTYGGGAQVETVLRGNRIESRASAIVSELSRPLLIEDNEIIGTQREPYQSYIPYLQNARAVFRGNRVFIPKEAFRPFLPWQGVFLLQYLESSASNIFDTDLDPGGGRYFHVEYFGTRQIRNDSFPTPAVRPCGGCDYRSTYSR